MLFHVVFQQSRDVGKVNARCSAKMRRNLSWADWGLNMEGQAIFLRSAQAEFNHYIGAVLVGYYGSDRCTNLRSELSLA